MTTQTQPATSAQSNAVLPFGLWLLNRQSKGDWIDNLTAAARRDPAFPKRGDPDEVRGRLNQLGADADMHECLDDAEREWAAN